MSHRSEPLVAPSRLRSRTWLGLVAAVAVLAFWLGGRLATARPASPPASDATAELALRLESLHGALAVEQAARESLAAELAELHAQLDAVVAQLEADGRGARLERSPGPDLAAVPEASAREEPRGEEPAAPTGAPSAPAFDVAALVAGGCMSGTDAEALRARWERHTLERLALTDRARRAGWFATPRYRRENAALDATLRDELGDDGYDAYLRATGKPNGLSVRELLPSGAGSAAGFEVGDELVRYAGQRIFSAADLQQLTAAGRPGELVNVEVLRGGQPTTLRAARGPLGVVLEGVVLAPEGC